MRATYIATELKDGIFVCSKLRVWEDGKFYEGNETTEVRAGDIISVHWNPATPEVAPRIVKMNAMG